MHTLLRLMLEGLELIVMCAQVHVSLVQKSW